MEHLLSLAAPYVAQLVRQQQGCCEGVLSLTEAHVQALWQNDALRPATFTTLSGATLTILEKGTWNHGAGPDFKNALIVVDGQLLRGDIECHRTPRDWDLHRHAKNPAFDDVILHVSWSTGPLAKTLPSRVHQLALASHLNAQGDAFDLQMISLSPSPAMDTPCQALYASEPKALEALLTSAGYHRFLLKAQQFLEKTACVSPFQAFYEGLMRAMGYERNAEAFTRLARCIPFEMIAPYSTLQRFAILAGVAGLLKAEERTLWDLWWQSGVQPLTDPLTWDFRALRPQNHPYRRLAGGVGVLDAIARLLDLPLKGLSKAIQMASKALVEPLHLSGTPLGEARANALVNNLFVPYQLATGRFSPKALSALPGESLSAPMCEVWLRLTGREEGLPKDGLRQQGLLQIYHDFCHNDHVVCATCPLAVASLQAPLDEA